MTAHTRKRHSEETEEQKRERLKKYYKTWYASKGSEVSERRRLRYRNDEDYLRRSMAAAQKYRGKIRRETLEELKAEYLKNASLRAYANFVNIGMWNEIEIDMGDEVSCPQTFLSIGVVARLFGFSRANTYLSVKKGIIPAPPIELQSGYYPPDMILAFYEESEKIRTATLKRGRSKDPHHVRVAIFDAGLDDDIFVRLYDRDYFSARLGARTEFGSEFFPDSVLRCSPIKVGREMFFSEGMCRAAHEVLVKYFDKDLKEEQVRAEVEKKWKGLGVSSWKFLRWANKSETAAFRMLERGNDA